MPSKKRAASEISGTLDSGIQAIDRTEFPLTPPAEHIITVSSTPNTSVRKKKPVEILTVRPSTLYDVYMMGSNDNGQLGMPGLYGIGSPALTPKFNRNLTSLNVVQVACGASHGVALTEEGSVFTWGTNDYGELGRDTTSHAVVAGYEDGHAKVRLFAAEQKRGMKMGDMGLFPPTEPHSNGLEMTPSVVKGIPDGITQVAASEAASFALTEDGKVWGWGTFRSNEGSLGLISSALYQPQYCPVLLTTFHPHKIISLACSPRSNHLVALSNTGAVHTIGTGEQNQLGRKLVERNKGNGLIDGIVSFSLPSDSLIPRCKKKEKIEIIEVATGDETSFAIGKDGRIWSWGQDDFAQTGHDLGSVDAEAAKEAAPQITVISSKQVADSSYAPQLVHSLASCRAGPVAKVVSGRDFALALTRDGEVYSWGRLEGLGLGLSPYKLASTDVRYVDGTRTASTVVRAHAVELGGRKVVDISAGPGHVMAVDDAGDVWVWGAGEGQRLGIGMRKDGYHADVRRPVICKAKERLLVRKAVAGGEFGVLLTERVRDEDDVASSEDGGTD